VHDLFEQSCFSFLGFCNRPIPLLPSLGKGCEAPSSGRRSVFLRVVWRQVVTKSLVLFRAVNNCFPAEWWCSLLASDDDDDDEYNNFYDAITAQTVTRAPWQKHVTHVRDTPSRYSVFWVWIWTSPGWMQIAWMLECCSSISVRQQKGCGCRNRSSIFVLFRSPLTSNCMIL